MKQSAQLGEFPLSITALIDPSSQHLIIDYKLY